MKGPPSNRYLNTPLKDPFTATECHPFDHPLVDVDSELQFEQEMSSTVPAKIIGVQKVSKGIACASCNKRALLKPHSSLAVCQTCNLTQSATRCQVQWTIRVLIENQEVQGKKFQLNLPHNITEAMMNAINPSLNLSAISEDEIIISILEVDKQFMFTYDKMSYQVTDFELN